MRGKSIRAMALGKAAIFLSGCEKAKSEEQHNVSITSFTKTRVSD